MGADASTLSLASGSGTEDSDPDSDHDAASAEAYLEVLVFLRRSGADLLDDRLGLRTAEEMLRHDFARNKTAWSGDCLADFWRFTKNTNPAIATCCSNPSHPIRKWERILVYAVSFFVVLFFAMEGELTFQCKDCHLHGACVALGETRHWLVVAVLGNPMDLCRPGGLDFVCDGAPLPGPVSAFRAKFDLRVDLERRWQLPGACCYAWSIWDLERRWQLPGACCYAWSIWAFWVTNHLNAIHPRFWSAFYAFLGNTVFSILSFQLMLCGCCQGQRTSRRRMGEHTGRLFFFAMAAYTLWRCRFIAVYIVQESIYLQSLKLFWLLKLWSWAGATVFQSIIFAISFSLQRPKPENHWLKWLDAPSFGEDQRGFLAKMLVPRFHVNASDYLCYRERARSEITEEDARATCDHSGYSTDEHFEEVEPCLD